MQPIRLLMACPDARGIIAAVTEFLARRGGNIIDVDQHTCPQHGDFFMRLEIDPDGFEITEDAFPAVWAEVAERHQMRWRIGWPGHRKRLAILVSTAGHCLNDLLFRRHTGELTAEIPVVISNHDALRAPVEAAGIAFHHLPIQPNGKAQQEAQIKQLVEQADVDTIVLARYMQILSPEFVASYPNRIINIHHSFLPAFAGAKPYHQAFERGVKLIGATSHYVTDDLDEGPIIAQQTLAVNHRDDIPDMVRKGRDLEQWVLARAVRYHIEDRIIVSGNKTVVFD